MSVEIRGRAAYGSVSGLGVSRWYGTPRTTAAGCVRAGVSFGLSRRIRLPIPARVEVVTLSGRVLEKTVSERATLGYAVFMAASRRECGAESEAGAVGWRAYLADDGEAFTFCPRCADREFGGRRRSKSG